MTRYIDKRMGIHGDKASTRFYSQYYKFIRHEKKRNVVVTAVAKSVM